MNSKLITTIWLLRPSQVYESWSPRLYLLSTDCIFVVVNKVDFIIFYSCMGI